MKQRNRLGKTFLCNYTQLSAENLLINRSALHLFNDRTSLMTSIAKSGSVTIHFAVHCVFVDEEPPVRVEILSLLLAHIQGLVLL